MVALVSVAGGSLQAQTNQSSNYNQQYNQDYNYGNPNDYDNLNNYNSLQEYDNNSYEYSNDYDYGNYNYENFDTGSATADIDGQPSIDGTIQPIHPKAASPWRTRELIMSVTLPDRLSLKECYKEIEGFANKAINEDVMLASIQLLVPSVRKNQNLYHWCFYYNVMLLDLDLDRPNLSRSYSKMYSDFIRRMKVFWILARALDFALSEKKYFGYIRKRYVQISKDYFGKIVEVISPPLGDRNRVVPYLNPKAASAFSGY